MIPVGSNKKCQLPNGCALIPEASIIGVFNNVSASEPKIAECNAGAVSSINDIGKLISWSIPFALTLTSPGTTNPLQFISTKPELPLEDSRST